jgi:hypothetical protein
LARSSIKNYKNKRNKRRNNSSRRLSKKPEKNLWEEEGLQNTVTLRHPESKALAADQKGTRTKLPSTAAQNHLRNKHENKRRRTPTRIMPPTTANARTLTGEDPLSLPTGPYSLDGARSAGVEEAEAEVAAPPTEVAAPGADVPKCSLRT